MTKRVPLVCQHLEGINRSALENYQKIVVNYVKDREGVYALYRRGKLYYVGLASNLRWRLKHHLKDRHGEAWDSFSVYLTIGDKHLKELESLLLRVIQPRPKGNKQAGKFAKSQNLLRQFKKDMKSFYEQDWNALIGRKTKKNRETGRQQARRELAKYMENRKPFTITARYKGRNYKATVRKDGSIRLKGQVLSSPSAAAAVIVGHAYNGWWFWQFERAPGDWVRLRKLRS